MMKERFAESEFLAGVPEKLGGAICMQVSHFPEVLQIFNYFFQYDKETNQGEFLWTHTTASMGIGFQVIYKVSTNLSNTMIIVYVRGGCNCKNVSSATFSTTGLSHDL